MHAPIYRIQVEQNKQFTDYISLIIRWNARTNLTSIRDETGIIQRHFVESIACAQALPAGIQTLLDFGSGAGFPGIPIAICRPEIAVTLAESQNKKAAFLQEVTRVLECSTWSNPIRVHAGRAETLDNIRHAGKAGLHPGSAKMLHVEHSEERSGSGFDCVTLRAVDKMEQAVDSAARLVRPGGWLALMTTVLDLPSLQAAAGAGFSWSAPVTLPGAESRILALGQKHLPTA